MRSRGSIAIGTLFLLASAVPAAAASPSVESASARHDRIVAHWTPERLQKATPRDFRYDAKRGFVPAAKPGTGGGGTTVTGASWTKGGQILKTSGKVYFEMGGGGYVCSGAVAKDSNTGRSLVLTAAHCAYDETARQFATNWMFIPEFDTTPTFTCANTKWGCWTASGLVVHSGYATAGGFNTQATVHDFAFAVVGNGGKSNTQLDATVGDFPITFSGITKGQTLYSFGYPASQKYKGNDLSYCAGPLTEDASNSNLTWGMACDMTGGSSGGPWLSSFSESTGSGTLSSLNSYGYSGVRYMYGPKFGTKTQDVYTAANTATGNTIVP